MHTLCCVCPPRVESLFPPVLLKSCNQILLAFKVWFSRNSSSHCRTPRLGSLMWGSEPSFHWVDFCGMCSPVCESPNQQLWDLILLWLFPSYVLTVASPLSLDVGYLFWWVPLSSYRWLFSSYLWFRCSCKRESTSFYSAVLNQSPGHWTSDGSGVCHVTPLVFHMKIF